MKILIIGANGQIGQMVAEKLKKGHHDPVAMIRKEDQVEKFKKKGIETVLADLEEDFAHAYAGVEVVVFAAGSGGHTGPDKTHLVDRIGAKNAIDLAVKNKIEHFIMISALGADYSPEKWPESMVHYYEAKADADKHLMQSGLDYTILQPGRLLNEGGTDKVIIGDGISTEDNSIPRADVATVISKIIGMESVKKKAFELLSGDTPIDQELKEVEAV